MPQGYWIVDVEALNRVYQAARNLVANPGPGALLTLRNEIIEAEHPNPVYRVGNLHQSCISATSS
jgi:hypothetical protein